MKYFVILIVTYSDDTKDKVSIYTYEDKDTAISNFYKYMGQYVNAENVATVCVECKDNMGGIYRNEAWSKGAEA